MAKQVANPVAILNEYSQKEKFNYYFEKFDEIGKSHCKQFTIRLVISKSGSFEFIEYFGEGNSLKIAKNNAAAKAISSNINEELKKKILSNPSTSSGVNSVTGQLSQLSINENKLDPIYEAWLFAKKNKILMTIDFINLKRGYSKIKRNVKIHLGSKSFSGKGETDMESIYNAASKINYEELSQDPSNKDSVLVEGSSDDDLSHKIIQLNGLSQQLNKPLEYIDLASLGLPRDSLYLYKCQFGDLVTYGLGSKKKIAKNQSASRMLSNLIDDNQYENFQYQIANMEKWDVGDAIENILKTEDNAISILEEIDKSRFESTLKFVEKSQVIGVQSYFTIECRILLMPDFKINENDYKNFSYVKNDLTYLKTSSKSTKKKTSKLEAAEKMVNLLRGDGAHTNEEVKMNKELNAFKKSFDIKEKIDNIPRKYHAILTKMVEKAIEFLKDKPTYDSDYDFLAEIQDMEFVNRGTLELKIRSTNEIYARFNNIQNTSKVTVFISLNCGIFLIDKAECLDEMEAKNEAAFKILKKLSNIRNF